MRFLSVVRCRTRCNRNRASSRSRRMLGSGSQIAATSSRWESPASTRASILSVLHANGASPLTFCASATSTSQPSSSSVSCTNRAPFIDSITARTRPAPTRIARWARPSASGAAAICATSSPASSTRHTSSRRRLRSNPACNMRVGLVDDTLSVPPTRPSFIAVQSAALGGGLAVWQLPARPREVAVVAVRVVLEVVLVLGLGLPERDGLADLGHHLAGPQARGVDVGDRVLGDLALLVARVEDLRAVAGADVVALAILGRGIVDLEEELQDVPVGDALGVEDDLDRLGVTRMVPVGGVLVDPAGVSDAS